MSRNRSNMEEMSEATKSRKTKWPSRWANVAWDFHHQTLGRRILLVVGFLNIVACLLVIAEIIVEVVYYTGMLAESEQVYLDFYRGMYTKYHIVKNDTRYIPNHRPNPDAYGMFLTIVLNGRPFFLHTTEDLQKKIYPNATIYASDCWYLVQEHHSTFRNFWSCGTHFDKIYPFGKMNGYDIKPKLSEKCDYHDESDALDNKAYYENPEKMLLDIPPKLHYAGLAIVCLLCLYVIFKIVCGGRRFFKSKMQICDGFSVLASLILEAIFVRSASDLDSETKIILRLVLLVCVVARVLNSLTVAVTYGQDSKMQMMKIELEVKQVPESDTVGNERGEGTAQTAFGRLKMQSLRAAVLSMRALGRWRRAAHVFHNAHSKPILTAIALLNIVESLMWFAGCGLAMFYFTGTLTKLEHMHSGFYKEMTRKYPILTDLGYTYDKDDPNVPVSLLHKVLNSYVVFHHSLPDRDDVIADCAFLFKNEFLPKFHEHVSPKIPKDWTCRSYLDLFQQARFTNCSYEWSSVLPRHYGFDFDGEYYATRSKLLSGVSHKLRCTSLAILCILCLYVLFKMDYAGCRFFTNKMQVFDGLVVLASLVLDCVIMDRVAEIPPVNTAIVKDYPINLAMIVITITLVWRIVRILNSLIIANVGHGLEHRSIAEKTRHHPVTSTLTNYVFVAVSVLLLLLSLSTLACGAALLAGTEVYTEPLEELKDLWTFTSSEKMVLTTSWDEYKMYIINTYHRDGVSVSRDNMTLIDFLLPLGHLLTGLGVTGVLVVAISLLGCWWWGSHHTNNKTALIVYSVGMSVFFIIEFVLVVLIYGDKSAFDSTVKTYIKGLLSGYSGIEGTDANTLVWNTLMDENNNGNGGCCGVDGYTDFAGLSNWPPSRIAGYPVYDLETPIMCCKGIKPRMNTASASYGCAKTTRSNGQNSWRNSGCYDKLFDLIMNKDELVKFQVIFTFAFLLTYQFIMILVSIWNIRAMDNKNDIAQRGQDEQGVELTLQGEKSMISKHNTAMLNKL